MIHVPEYLKNLLMTAYTDTIEDDEKKTFCLRFETLPRGKKGTKLKKDMKVLFDLSYDPRDQVFLAKKGKDIPTTELHKACIFGFLSDKEDAYFFDTPAEYAKAMVVSAGIASGMTALEPSAGNGAIARWMRKTGCGLTLFEKDIKRSNRLREAYGDAAVQANMNLVHKEPLFDRIITTPPAEDAVVHFISSMNFLKPKGMIVGLVPSFYLNKELKWKISRLFSEIVQNAHGKVVSGCRVPITYDERTYLMDMSIVTIKIK